MTDSRRISYVMMAALLVLIGWFHLGVLVLTAFFGYFALEKFSFGRSKILGLAIYLIVVAGIGVGLYRDEAEAFERVYRRGRVLEPDLRLTAQYRERFPIFQRLYPALREIHSDLRDGRRKT